MIILLYVLAVLLVWIIGITSFSFVNTVAYRFPRNKKIFKEHFSCDTCGQQLEPWEIIPVLSYLVLKGRCKHCGDQISKREFVNELIGGFIALLPMFQIWRCG